MKPTPIKRSKSLIPLSQDHHDGLLLVWKIRQGCKIGIPASRITDFVLQAFQQQLEPHFTEEEQLLFAAIVPNDPLQEKAAQHHAALRSMQPVLSDQSADYNALTAFADLLEQHIRFEERELFKHCETLLSPTVMESIGEELCRLHNSKKPLTWKDEFWIKRVNYDNP